VNPPEVAARRRILRLAPTDSKRRPPLHLACCPAEIHHERRAADSATLRSQEIRGCVGDVLRFEQLGFVLALGGITMIRTRGETALAIAALILALALTGFANPLLFGYGFGLGD